MGQITLLTGPERRRRWSEDERQRILAAAFAPGAVVADISRQFEVSTSLIYKWREQAMAGEPATSFAPAVLAAEPLPASPLPETAAIIVDLANGTRLKIGAQCSAALATAALQALR
jgi:transposase